MLTFQIIIENNKAVGVEFQYNDKVQVVKARKEVIVSAGTENTPKLLMLSGIGPQKELKKLKVRKCGLDKNAYHD